MTSCTNKNRSFGGVVFVSTILVACFVGSSGFPLYQHQPLRKAIRDPLLFDTTKVTSTNNHCNTNGRIGSCAQRTFVGCLLRQPFALFSEKVQEDCIVDPLNWTPVHTSKSDNDNESTINSSSTISNILVVGDGDLSFSAYVAESLAANNIKIIATVLEEREQHQDVYQRSKTNEETILSFSGKAGHQVRFGIDATKLDEFFPTDGDGEEGDDDDGDDDGTIPTSSFDRIQFNFPHWRGKANHKYNRQLIDAFLKSASEKLSPGGEIHMALVQGQGGSSATSLEQYRDTWTPNMYAAQHGLLLYRVEPFEAMYNLSSHRGVDRGFKLGKEPKMFIFGKPEGLGNRNDDSNGGDDRGGIEQKYQLCCRHELHIILPPDDNDTQKSVSSSSCSDVNEYSLNDIVEGDAIQSIVQGIVPDGIRVEVPSRTILKTSQTGYETEMAVFVMVYCGEKTVIRREEADQYRHLAEEEVGKHVPLRENRRGRLISKPFPYYLLGSMLESGN